MTDLPILINAEMARATLSGSKAQTRRIMSPQPGYTDGGAWAGGLTDGVFHWGQSVKGDSQNWILDNPIACPFGSPGDRLWVRKMPRWASRIMLEVTGVRVERLQEISRGDVMAEGCPFPNMQKGPDPRQWFRDLWETINGPGSWDANPWVWAIEFKRIYGEDAGAE